MNFDFEGIPEWGGPGMSISSPSGLGVVNRARKADGLESGLRTSVSVRVDGEIVKKPFS